MIIKKQGDKFYYKNIEYVIGDEIIGTAGSAYEGLVGKVYEIRTDGDKETDNNAPDFYCSFEPPITNYDMMMLEKRFSELYGENKNLDDICLDSVIMSSEMIHSISENDVWECKVYILKEDWAANYDYGHSIKVFSNIGEAKSTMIKTLKEEFEEGHVKSWKDNSDFVEDSDECSYECYIEGCHVESHYSISIAEQTMKFRYPFMIDVVRKYVEKDD